MTELLTAAQMRAIEQAAIASGEVTGLELMERAGRGVVEAILDWRPELATAPHRAVVLCGPGNNGGDGFVVARLLRERGWEVEVFLYGDEAKLPPDAAENCRRWREMGEVVRVRPDTAMPVASDVVVDALFGAGLTRPLEPELLKFCDRIFDDRGATDFIAVDCLSGLCMSSGRPIADRSAFPWADLTVTFHRCRPGHFLAEGPSLSGDRVVRVDIGLGLTKAGTSTVRLAQPLERPLTRKSKLSHKYAHGHALILSGGVGRGGAARLAARGALRIGAGLVTVGAPPAALIENAAQLNAIMLAPVADAEALMTEMAARKVQAVCIGPGLGFGQRTRALVATTLAARVGTVLDGDALTEYRDDPQTLFSQLHDNCVLTPHEGEFGRLFPDLLERLKAPATRGPAYSKVDATREAAKLAGCVVLFKGADTVIADPDGRCSINAAHYERAAPWLATAGSGDVLAGYITGLLARGFAPMAAAETAAWLHVECARKFGPGLIAEDLPEQLPAVFRDLGL
ncbi:NAD(P)H-hydrate dehydratase [Limibaculum sp. M0105]|uniref:Bifunctional NAD(P)H-hydrate repair enzyme n=1 Tax=Thermohalobaculum xanthum TaxID=2753746 RepID=A0A8J7M3R4_9RHOB|nr:NAD(P)H-hydrate dehydratase [Thermohalobaculum xanthum]MBK0397765.1 NAD(P)H-hydrate dehydratase [Thermohalobaculum xanthum]